MTKINETLTLDLQEDIKNVIDLEDLRELRIVSAEEVVDQRFSDQNHLQVDDHRLRLERDRSHVT